MPFPAQVASRAASAPAVAALSAPLTQRFWFDSWLPLVLLSLFSAAAVSGVAAHHFRINVKKQQQTVAAVADLKAQALSEWLEERVRTASLYMNNASQAELYQQWHASGDPEARDRLLLQLDQLAVAGGFADVSLIDEHSTVIWHKHAGEEFPAPLRNALPEVAQPEQVSFFGPYWDRSGVQLDFITTLPVQGHKPIVVLHTGTDQFFPQSLGEWPLSSATSEVLLARREGNDLLSLVSWQNGFGTASGARLRLQATWSGAFEGEAHDSSGTRVYIAARPIPGTDWHLVAKSDRSEIAANSLAEILWIILLGALLYAVALAALLILRQQRRLDLVQAARDAQAARLRATSLLAAIAESSSDAITVKDLEGRYLLFSEAASEITGKPAEAVLGFDDHAVFPIAQAEMLQAENRRVIEENRIITFEESLDTTRGRRVFLATKGPLHNELGETIGVFGISRDITERQQDAAALRERTAELCRGNEELQRFNRAMVDRELEMIGLKNEVNRLSEQLGLERPFRIPSGA